MPESQWASEQEVADWLGSVPDVGRVRVLGMRCGSCGEPFDIPGYEGQAFTVSASRFRAILQFQHNDDCEGRILAETEPA